MPILEDNLFPPSDRVFYERAPLTEVTCQLRFPPVLRIESQAPADFQDRIRKIFPLVERAQDGLQEIPAEVLQSMGIFRQGAGFAFSTESRAWTLALMSQQLVLTTQKYTQWKEFMDFFHPALRALVELYEPAFFQRIGLRYVNVIERSALGLSVETPWSDLLRQELLGEL